MRGQQAIERVVKLDRISSVLDIGSWNGLHANYFREKGFKVSTVDFNANADFQGNYLDIEFPNKFDCIWCSHTLEHQHNVGIFLKKCYNDLNDDGVFAVTVPSQSKYGDKVVDGHVTYWNAGVLLYNLIVNGFDCSEAMVGTYDDQVSVIVRKKQADLPSLTGDRGELDRLSKFFPMRVQQGFNGHIKGVNW